jgi:hypothetical protein
MANGKFSTNMSESESESENWAEVAQIYRALVFRKANDNFIIIP